MPRHWKHGGIRGIAEVGGIGTALPKVWGVSDLGPLLDILEAILVNLVILVSVILVILVKFESFLVILVYLRAILLKKIKTQCRG